MIFGISGFGQEASRVVAVVNDRDISRARSLLLALAKRFKGSSLTDWQRNRIARMAPAVAMRTKRGLSPALSREQAIEVHQIVSS